MVEFSPFAGVRYDCEAAGPLESLAAPPYDVIDEDERAALEHKAVHNSVRLLLPRDHAAEGDRYEGAARAFEQWRTEGVLTTDSTPRFYPYRMTFTDPHGRTRQTRGVIGAMTLPEPGADDVLPHERTLPKAKSDRLSLLRAMRVNVDPIWGLSLANGLTRRLDTTPIASCVDADGVRHDLGAIDDPAAIAEISRLVASAPIVLADGHHRFETALNYRNELRAAGKPVGDADAIMIFVVELDDDELDIEPIHRLLELPPDVDLRVRLADAFEIHSIGPNTPEKVDALERAMNDERAIGIVDGLGVAVARAYPKARDEAPYGEHPAVASTDAAVIEALVVPRLPEAQWQYRHDAREVSSLVEKGSATAALLCRPVSVAQTRAAAIDRVRMPQKSTFFTPKPRSGMVFRAFD